jgi:hypothetical protein
MDGAPDPGFFLRIGDDAAKGELVRLEILDRDSSTIGLVEFRSADAGRSLSEANRRRLRDFEKPLGALLEMCLRAKRKAESY